MEFVNFLKNPQQYLDLGAKIPKVSDVREKKQLERNPSLGRYSYRTTRHR